MLHEKTQASILLQADLSVCLESYYYYYVHHGACSIGRVYHASVVKGCVPMSAPSNTITRFSNTITRQRRFTTTAVARRSCRTHENCMHAEQIIIIFYIFYFIFCSIYLVLFSIVWYWTIVTVYTNNIFLYNYRQQMHQIIHVSPVGVLPTK